MRSKSGYAVLPLFVAAIISLVIPGLISRAGLLRGFERKFYDLALRARPPESATANIVIVGLTEKDITTLGYPVNDQVLADLINKIDEYKPRVIGLDLHRNVNIGEEGNEELDRIFTQNQKIIGVEKTNGGIPSFVSIPPPIQLELAGRTGASEVIKDADEIVRRGYLYTQKVEEVEESKSKRVYVPSLGLAVALKYLEGAKFLTEESFKGWLKRNRSLLPKLNKVDFFYRRGELDFYQILIDYSFPQESFEQVSFVDVLEENISSSLMEDQIVLIGSTAPSLKDIYSIAYPRSSSRKFIYGVELHGIISHQIIAAILNERKIISFPSLPLQYFWIGIWLVSISWASGKFCLKTQAKRPEMNCLLIGAASSIIIIISGYGLLFAGWVVPTVTTLFLVVGHQVIIDIFIRFNQLSRAKMLLEEEVEKKTEALKQAQKKILEQKKFQVHERIVYNIAHEINNKINSVQLQLEDSQSYLDKLNLFIQNNPDFFEDEDDDEDSTPQVVKRLEKKILELLDINEDIAKIIENIYQGKAQVDQVKEKVNLNHVLDEIVTEIVKIKQSENLQLIVERNYEQNLSEINCIVTEVERALEKLIENAVYQVIKKYQDIQHTDSQPKIILTTENKSNSVLIKIKDNGMGIEDELTEKIFESFWSTKPSGEGMGLGLCIAKELIEKHGGEILVDSEPGEWAEFTVILPLCI